MMVRQRSRLAAISVGAITIGVLAGCSADNPSDLPVFDNKQQSVDVLPATIIEQLSGPDLELDLDLESSRYVGEDNGATYYVAHDQAETMACIVIFVSNSSWVSGCGSQSGLETSIPGHNARFTVDGIVPSGEEWTVLHENVLVR
ncbi:MAG TPA: hypothetical protein VGP24_03515 [Glaciihabitans sp.]|jgi:hypothetical protein|nr:hypothetical protein [Glaciihabitans sp.]